MKNYTITVNGHVYDVTVEENGAAATEAAMPAKAAAPKPTPKAESKVAGNEGAVKVNAPMPGKILGVKVTVGQVVSKGDVLLVLEAMKMENEIVAPSDGTVAGINVASGSTVEAGDILASLN